MLDWTPGFPPCLPVKSRVVLHHQRVERSGEADGNMRLLQGRKGTGELSLTERMDVQLSVEETYAGTLHLQAWQCLQQQD